MLLKTDKVQKSISRVRKFLKKKPKNPAPEKVHKIRTSARRLESSLDVMDLGRKQLKKRIERNLAVVRKRLGKVRDMDVLTSHAISVAPKISDRECLVELLEHLGAKRAGYAEKLRKAAKDKGSRLRADLDSIADEMDDLTDRSRRNGELKVEFNGRQDNSLEELMTELDRPTQLNRGNLHPFRLKVKELRYVLQLSENEHSEGFVKKLGEVKDAIGEWHDWEELVAIATEVLGGKPQPKLVQELKTISGRKFKDAISLTNDLRKTYGDDKRRKLLHAAVDSQKMQCSGSTSAP
jgi:CHAD domain-containing protein